MNIPNLFKRILTLSLILSVLLASFPVQVLADTFEAEVVVSKMPVREGKTADTTLLGYLEKGVVVTVLQYGDGIAYIEYKGKKGYARVSDMKRISSAEKAPEETDEPDHGLATVIEKEIIVYERASDTSKQLAKLKKNATILVLEVDKNGWAKLENGDYIGYTKKEGLKIDDKAKATASPVKNSAKGTATVTAASLPIYASASTDSRLMTTLKKGQTFTVLATGNGWAKLQNGSHIGYARLIGLSLGGEAEPTPSPTPTSVPTSTPSPSPKSTEKAEQSKSGLATVKVHSTRVYAEPSTSSRQMSYIYKGATYTLLATSGEWAKIQNGKYIGYALLSDLTITAGATPTSTATASPTPTATPKPANTPVPDASKSGLAVVNVNSTYVYASPSTGARKMCSITKGQTFTLLATNGEWAKLQNGKYIGYAKLSHLTVSEGAKATPTPTATPVPTATPIPVPDVIEGPIAEVTVTKMYVYASKSVSAESLGSLKKGSTVTVLDYDETWAKIYKDNKVGYCKLASLKYTGDYTGATPVPTATPKPTFTPAPTSPIQAIMEVDSFVNVASAKIYASVSTSSAVLKTVAAGFELTVLGVNGDWAYVEYDSSRGYMLKNTLIAKSSATLTETMNSPAVISASSLTVYKFASKYAPSYGSFKKGTEVTVLAYKDGWAMLKRGNAIGYADASGITVVSQEEKPTLDKTCSLPALIKTDKTKVYTYATQTSKVISTLALSQEITVRGYDDTWCLIESGSTSGYVLKSNLILISDIELTAKGSYPGVVTATSAEVYKYASEISKKLATLKKGATFNVLAQGNGWGLIEQNGNKGYMKLSNMYVQIDEFTSPTVKNLSATVIKSSLTAYSCALENNDYKAGTLNIGDTANVTAYTDKWARVSVNGEDVYVLRKYLSNETYTALSASSGSKTEINNLQKALENLGYFDGNPAGNYGSLTTAAVQRFQKQLGLEVTGNADLVTLRILYSSEAPESSIRTKTLSKNDTGSDVTRLQNRLTYKGYMNSSIDGDYGSITESAVKIYQKVAGLTETGTADVTTLKSLFSSSAPANNSGNVAGSGNSSGSGNGNYSTNPDDDLGSGTASEKAETVIDWGLKQLGKKYVYGNEGPNTFDCSGFTQFCYGKVGVKLRRSAQAQGYNDGTKITSISNLKRGDIVCFNTIDDSDLSDHVGIYLGNNQFVHASSGAGKIVISSLSSGYYKRVFSWGRRVL